MASRLLTIEGVYDGKSIRPLESIKASGKHRVLITFLEEIDLQDEFGQQQNLHLSNLPVELFKQLEMLASAAGANDVKSYVITILQEKIQAAKNKEFVYEVTNQIRNSLNQAGISEQEILDDFSRFRRAVTRE